MEQLRLVIALTILWPMAAGASDYTIPNTFTNGTIADADDVNANFTAAKTAIDDNARDTHYYVVDDGALTQADLHAALTAACNQPGGTNLHSGCREVILPVGTFTFSDTFFITGQANAAPSGASGEGVWGLHIRGAGGSYIQTPGTSAATSQCATTLVWDGADADPMIWVHAGRNVKISDLCLILDGGQDGVTGNPPASHGIIATSNSGEISEGVILENVDIYGFSSSWAHNADFSTTCVALLPSDFSGDPPYATSTQVDHFVIRSSRLFCHRLFLGANGASGTNGVTLMNVSGAYSDYGLWAESTDLQVYSGKFSTWVRFGQTGDEATMCGNSDAWLKIGSTSSDQAKIVSVIGSTVEGDCGEAVATVDATDGANQRDSTTTLVNTSINWGAASEDHVINYTHHGSFLWLGGFPGIRNGQDYTTAGRSFLSVLPDTRTARTLALRLSLTNLDDWDTGVFRVERNAQVDLIGDDEISSVFTRDDETFAAGDVSGSISAGLTIGAGVVEASMIAADVMTTNSTLSMLTTGTVSFKTNIISAAVGGTITSTGALNMVYRHTGGSPATFNLPAPETGMAACFRAATAQVLTVDVASVSDSIILDGVTLSGGNSIDSAGAAGDYVCLLAVSSTQWETWGRSGTWVDGGI